MGYDGTFSTDLTAPAGLLTVECRTGSTFVLHGVARMADGSGVPLPIEFNGTCPSTGYLAELPSTRIHGATHVEGTLTVTSPTGSTDERGSLSFWSGE